MTQRKSGELSRKELYNLVWAEPMVALSKQFGLSDSGLAKICRAADIPIPYRGYWAKLAADKKVVVTLLPTRGLGKSDSIQFGSQYWAYGFNFLNFELPPPPTFTTNEIDVVARVKQVTKKAKLVKTLSDPHNLIRRLMDLDAARIEKAKGQIYSWTKPYFDTPFEKRRLKILNSIFLMAQTSGFKADIDMTKARAHSILIGDQRVGFDFESIKIMNGRHYDRNGQDLDISNRSPGEPMRLKIKAASNATSYPSIWEDSIESKIEDHLREIFEAFVFHGEMNMRQHMISHHQWLKERIDDALAKEKQRLEAAEQQRIEKLQKLEALRLDTLLVQADNLRKAEAIRNYVDKSRIVLGELPPDEQAAFETWTDWSLAQADRIDPVKNKMFLIPEPQMP